MTPPTTLSVAEVDALFAGKALPRATQVSPTPQKVAWVARYDRCSSCRAMKPCLASFSGDTDWSPTITLDDRLRDAVKSLRVDLGRRTILLCDRCIDRLSEPRVTTPSPDQPTRLFES